MAMMPKTTNAPLPIPRTAREVAESISEHSKHHGRLPFILEAPSLHEPELHELMRQLLDQTDPLEVHEIAALLQEQDVWAIPGIVQKRIGTGDASFTVGYVGVNVRGQRPQTLAQVMREFDVWLRETKPHLVEAWEAARAMRALEHDITPRFDFSGTETGRLSANTNVQNWFGGRPLIKKP